MSCGKAPYRGCVPAAARVEALYVCEADAFVPRRARRLPWSAHPRAGRLPVGAFAHRAAAAAK
eukprot:11226283-Heterocapsa_arctica.AAC.1